MFKGLISPLMVILPSRHSKALKGLMGFIRPLRALESALNYGLHEAVMGSKKNLRAV